MSGIGQFQIGISAIGVGALTPPFDINATIISQYANSPRIVGLIQDFDGIIDPGQDVQSFFDNEWNVDTAVGYGLDVWGRIVGVSRILQVTAGRYFGFETGDTSWDPFNVSPFFGGTPFTENYSLSDDAYRQLIYAKAAANICDGSIPAINNILMMLFGSEGNCYVTDGENMTMTYTFEFTLTPVQQAIIEQSGVLPRSNGVAASVVII